MRLRSLSPVFVTLLVLAPGPALAQGGADTPAQPLTLEAALALAPAQDAAVLNARSDLDAAQRADRRQQADPLALRIPRLQAEQAVAAARETLRAAQMAARLRVLRAYHGALEAEDDVALAQVGVDIAQMALEAARIRLDAGAASTLDVDRAENDLADAQRALADASQGRALAYRTLASDLALPDGELSLQEPPAPARPAGLDAVLGRVDENAGVAAAGRALALARAGLEAVDNPYSARADVESARDRLASAQRSLEDARTGLELRLRQSHNALVAADGRRSGAEAALATAEKDVQAQQVRFTSGSISRLQLAQAQRQRQQAAAQALVARHAVQVAALQLEITVLGGSATPSGAP